MILNKEYYMGIDEEHNQKEPKTLVRKPRILVIGSGGREHAIVWKLAQSKLKPRIYCIPGNPGIRRFAECINVDITNIDKVCEIAKDKRIDTVIVGPELPLSLGIVDKLEEIGVSAFGPYRDVAVLESSKIFAKTFMDEFEIPTARFEKFEDAEKAKKFLPTIPCPFVVKADGLASGKGVFICDSIDDGIDAIDMLMINMEFGSSGSKIIIEEFLDGDELSFMVFTDGKTVVPMTSSQDHKALENRDIGPNTGGMGAYSPVPLVTKELEDVIMNNIMIPTIKGIYKKTGVPYKGVLYAGLMLVDGNPKVLEYNIRFGDPEAQVILTRLDTDLIDIINACINCNLEKIELKWNDYSSVCVIAASGGYPEAYTNGYEIKGTENVEDLVFMAGVKNEGSKLLTNGGRVLNVVALADSLDEAKKKAYSSIEKISFDKMYYRRDIGKIK
jgi:phosphoribosylamine--glycine ligase